ncbi:Hydrogenase 1 maturation protease [Pseudomonas extremaustralis]|uniref:Hydrogenase 1 maturation peptidase HyaD. Aspartic peptidase. MEROPS family A31 n=3 Tax=Pseudomonas extremaustralis TaxID=359110 RepID=A0ABY0N3V6_9PSED|nr:HyaD/HybD family hydrogenase maturation endopeptidase [Pseudomonas extremaustralis]EZI30216.1 hydrogenase [Pseudomonas extremaustralis 14-3 substr. 14-3b]MDY7066366.1 Hydrogenase 1 maturation protease [Pseudomonas extremaustralis]SDE93614.1 Hydrogenase 1 maturation peptidase HyaD. Aspartic peptidase. MEROPS family A31 [Pseudomonas extremaustralis]
MTTLVETAMSPLQPTLPQITVLGIGNLLWADEGFGVRCVEALQQRYEFADNVALIDGGTQGLYLIQHVQQADYLLIFDAVDYNLAPGELKFIADDEVPKFLGIKKLSLHQTGFQEVLMLAQLTGHYPTRVLLIGCQPENMMDYGGSLRPSVRAAMEGALDEALRVLDSWGAAPQKRATPLAGEEAVTLPHLELQRYENERPSEQQACRIGDERILARRA